MWFEIWVWVSIWSKLSARGSKQDIENTEMYPPELYFIPMIKSRSAARRVVKIAYIASTNHTAYTNLNWIVQEEATKKLGSVVFFYSSVHCKVVLESQIMTSEGDTNDSLCNPLQCLKIPSVNSDGDSTAL